MSLNAQPEPTKDAPTLTGEVAPQLPLNERFIAATTPQEVAEILIDAIRTGVLPERLAEAFAARAEALGKLAPEREVSAFLPAYRGIFGPQTSCRASLFAEPVLFNDPALFGADFLVKALSRFQGQAASPEILRGVLPNVALWAQALYFDSFRSEESVPGERRNVLGNHDGDVSLSELRGKRFVACAERAPANASVLAVLGFDVLTVCSECNLDGEAEMHVFNVVAGREKFFIADPTNPVVWRYQDGRRTFSLGAYPIPTEQLQSFAAGGTVTASHRDMQEVSPEKFGTSPESRREYRGPRGCAELCREFFRLDR
jgi:hypothetical protein